MRAFITGAAGFIGYHLSKRLTDDGDEVLGIDDLNDYYDVNLKLDRLSILRRQRGFTFEKIAVEDFERVKDILRRFRPDLVVHLAAYPGVRYSQIDPFQSVKTNIGGFLTVLEASKQTGVRTIFYASSSSVYGESSKLPFSTHDRSNSPRSIYAVSKMTDELMATTYAAIFGLSMTGLRFFSVYGPWGRPDMAVYRFTDSLISGKALVVHGAGAKTRDFTYIDDVVDGIGALLARRASLPEEGCDEMFNLGSGRSYSILELIENLEQVTGVTAKILHETSRPEEVSHTLADMGAFRDLFGDRRSTSLHEGLEKFVEWFKGYHDRPLPG